MPTYILFNTVKNDGLGDFVHLEDIMRAIRESAQFDGVSFLIIVLFEERESNLDLYQLVLSRLTALGHDFIFGTKSEHHLYTSISHAKYHIIQEKLAQANQAIIISYDAIFSLYEPFLKENLVIKYISEHDSVINKQASLIYPNSKHKYPRELKLRGMGLSINQNYFGIKIKSTAPCSNIEAFDVIKTHDRSFLEQVLASTKSESVADISEKYIIIPAYFNSMTDLAYFIQVLTNNLSIPKDKHIIVYHSGAKFSDIYRTKFDSLITNVFDETEHFIQVFEPGQITAKRSFNENTQKSRRVFIYSGFYLNSLSFKALYQLAFFAAVSGDNSFEDCVSRRVLPFYWSTNASFKEDTFDALISIANRSDLKISSRARKLFECFFMLCKETTDNLDEYTAIDFPAMIEAWPKIATCIEKEYNFYNNLNAIFCEALPPIALPPKIRRRNSTHLSLSITNPIGVIASYNNSFFPKPNTIPFERHEDSQRFMCTIS